MTERRNGGDRRRVFRGGRRASDRILLAALAAVGLSVLAVDAAPKPCKPPLLTLSAPTTGTVGQAVPFTASVQPATGNCHVASWYLAFGDGGLMNGSTATTFSTAHTYTTAAEFTAELGAQAVTGPPAPPKQVRIVVGDTPPPPPSGHGPQASIVCPAGAVNVSPGSSIQSAVNAQPTGATFCLRAGVHPVLGSITPKSGQTFVGEFGAILDGSGWSTSDPNQGAFRAHNQDIDGVTLRNIVIRRMPQAGVHAFADFSNGWVFDHVELADNRVGLRVGADTVVTFSHIHHNSLGGYAAFKGSRTRFEDNDISFNGREQKIVTATDVIFRRNLVHDNVGAGIWFDSDNTNALIEDNTLDRNGEEGIFFEISAGAIIRRNIINTSGLAAIFVSTSKGVVATDNILSGNFRGLQYFLNCVAIGQGVVVSDLTNNRFENNTVTVPATPSGSFGAIFGYDSGCTQTQIAPYLNGSKGNVYVGNDYTVPTVTGRWWVWGLGALKTWTEWRALGHDTTGSVQ